MRSNWSLRKARWGSFLDSLARVPGSEERRKFTDKRLRYVLEHDENHERNIGLNSNRRPANHNICFISGGINAAAGNHRYFPS